jgi:hypothetical protein
VGLTSLKWAIYLFNQDEEENPPAAWVRFREAIKPLDGFL